MLYVITRKVPGVSSAMADVRQNASAKPHRKILFISSGNRPFRRPERSIWPGLQAQSERLLAIADAALDLFFLIFLLGKFPVLAFRSLVRLARFAFFRERQKFGKISRARLWPDIPKSSFEE